MKFWIARVDVVENNCGIEEDIAQMSTSVEIVLQVSHNDLARAEEYK